jgi:hypothetical protein
MKKGRQVKTPKPLVFAKATAKVAAIAKYEVKKQIIEVIPGDVTRAKASAWLTLLSPITHWAGLKGDQLAHKRQLLRIQQEETLAEIARRAMPRIEALRKPIKPVPAKFLVPFLEKASLEEPDSRLVELWASLLVSAAKDYNPHFVHFANIISQLSAPQAKIFEAMIGPEGPHAVFVSLESAMNFEFLHNFLQEFVRERFEAYPSQPSNVDEMWRFMEDLLEIQGIEIEHIDIDDLSEKAPYVGGLPAYSGFKDDLQTDFLILETLRLIKYVDTGFFDVADRWRVKVMFYHVTPLGITFAKACDVRSEKTSE